MKLHLHCEQFDGYLHAVCGELDQAPDAKKTRILEEDAFEKAKDEKLCQNCRKYWFPKGRLARLPHTNTLSGTDAEE